MALPKIKPNEKYTYYDYLTWNDNERWELIHGKAYIMSPAPSREHQKISRELLLQLGNFFKDKKCEVYNAPFDVRLTDYSHAKDEDIDTVVQPDIVVICDEKKLDEKGCKGAPDLTIEILSPSSTVMDLKIKLNLYEKNKVKEYWIADPEKKLIMIFKLDKKGKFIRPDVYTNEDNIEVKMFKGLNIDLKDIFK